MLEERQRLQEQRTQLNIREQFVKKQRPQHFDSQKHLNQTSYNQAFEVIKRTSPKADREAIQFQSMPVSAEQSERNRGYQQQSKPGS